MRFYRKDRVSSLIQEELGALLLREMEFHGALVTIMGVDVSKDLEVAHVDVSVLPSERAEEVLRLLHGAQKHLQFLLLRKLNIMPMPKILFRIDHGPEHAAAVEKALLEDDNRGTNNFLSL